MNPSPRSRYFAQDSPDAFERARLALLTQIFDPVTARRLTALGVGPGWRCLEVGAGDGTVARWLARRVGTEGRVVATDLNPRFLGDPRPPNLEVRRHDLLEGGLEQDHYDLAHCRFVLEHLPDPTQGLRRMVDAVRPGGWLLVEEFDVGSFVATDPGHARAAAFDRRMRTLQGALQDTGSMDPTLGRRLPAVLEQFGVQELGHEGVTLIGRGGAPIARFARMSCELMRDRFVGVGALTAADFDELDRAFDDPSFWFVGFTSYGAWGRPVGLTHSLRAVAAVKCPATTSRARDSGQGRTRRTRTRFPQLVADFLDRHPCPEAVERYQEVWTDLGGEG
jgi:SAM-dependent methyltransferase